MIAFVLVSIILAFAIQKYLLANALKNVYYHSWPSKNLIEPGEPFDIVSEVHNDKWLPVLYVALMDKLPQGAKIHGASEEMQEPKRFYMLPYQKIRIRTPVTIDKRGRHQLAGGMLYGGDFFGLSTSMLWKNIWGEIVVIPRRIENPSLDMLLGGFLGDISVRRFIMPDPVLTVGVREYTGREPQKDISWIHSVRAGELLVKQYDHTLEMAVTVILNLETAEGSSIEVMEQCYSITRNICEELEQKKIKYSFLTNVVAVGAIGRANDLRDGLGSRHLGAILECLGRGAYLWHGDFEGLLGKALGRAEQGRHHIIVTPSSSHGQEAAIHRLRVISGAEAAVITPEGLSLTTNYIGEAAS